MSETNMNAFVNGYAGLVNNYILTPVVQHLASRGVQITTEELSTVLQLPAQRVAAAYPTSATGAPLAFGGAAPTMSPSVQPTKSKPRAPAVIPPGAKLCTYKFKRGTSRGETCGRPTAGGLFCNACLKSRKNLNDDGTPAAVPGVAPGLGGIPGTLDASNQQPQGTIELDVEHYDEERGLYRDTNTHFVIHRSQDGTVLTVIGKHPPTDTKVVPLTAADREQARSMGLTVADSAAAHVPQVPAPVANIPAVQHAYAPLPVPAAVPSAVPSAYAPSAVPHAVPSAVPHAVPMPQQAYSPQVPAAVPHAVPMPQQAYSPQVPSAVPHAVPMPQQAYSPQVPAAVPQMPAAIPRTPQMPAGIPQIPSAVPQMPAGIPQIPSAVPQMPVMPQMPAGIPQAR